MDDILSVSIESLLSLSDCSAWDISFEVYLLIERVKESIFVKNLITLGWDVILGIRYLCIK